MNLLKGLSPQKALEHVTAAVYEMMKQTKGNAEYELQVVAAQDQIALPQHHSRRHR